MYISDDALHGPATLGKAPDPKVRTSVWAHGAYPLARDEAEKWMNRVFGALARRNVALFGNRDVQLHIIPKDRKLTDLAEFASLKGTRTHDGRLYDDVRGVGGITAGTSILFAVGEDALVAFPGKPFYRGGAVVCHEGGHVVHRFGFTKHEQKRVESVFAKRKKANGPWVDPYASSNPEEYFACATEAFFMNVPMRKGDAPTPATREWLRAFDRPVHALLQDVFPGA
jgi:hypothetical protein